MSELHSSLHTPLFILGTIIVSTMRVILPLAEGAQHRNLAKALLDGVCNTLPKVVCILVRSYDEPICELDSRAVGE